MKLYNPQAPQSCSPHDFAPRHGHGRQDSSVLQGSFPRTESNIRVRRGQLDAHKMNWKTESIRRPQSVQYENRLYGAVHGQGEAFAFLCCCWSFRSCPPPRPRGGLCSQLPQPSHAPGAGLRWLMSAPGRGQSAITYV